MAALQWKNGKKAVLQNSLPKNNLKDRPKCRGVFIPIAPHTGEIHISNIHFGNYKTTREKRKHKLLGYGDSTS